MGMSTSMPSESLQIQDTMDHTVHNESPGHAPSDSVNEDVSGMVKDGRPSEEEAVSSTSIRDRQYEVSTSNSVLWATKTLNILLNTNDSLPLY